MSKSYILDGHDVVETDLQTWARWFEKGGRKVAYEEIGDSGISTVFLGIDHSFDGGPPLLFETMVFGGNLDQEMTRCTTWEEAEAMHRAMCERVRSAASQQPADNNHTPTPDAQWPKRAEIVAVLSAHYGAPAESVEEWLTDYFSWQPTSKDKPNCTGVNAMIDPDQLAKKLDDALAMVAALTADIDKCVAALPGSHYMDPPDGGDVSVSEQLRRMAKDAARYRYLERKVAIAGAQFHFLNLPLPVHVCAPIAAAELRAVIDMEIGALDATRPPTPVGWSDSDWIKHLQEQKNPMECLHINQGSMDAAADAYEAEYNAAMREEERRMEFDAEMRLDVFGPKHG